LPEEGGEIFPCDAQFAAVARHADLAIAVPSTSRDAVSCRRGVFARRRRGPMSTGVQTAVGKFVWHDHGSPNPATATKFYADLFGWEYETFKPGEIDYEMVKANGQLHGGFGSPPGNPPAQWMGHVLVKHVDETVLRAEGAGGKILAEPMDMPEVGRMAVIADPQGAVIAAFSPQGDAPQNGGTFVWDELLTTDVDDAKRFYGEVFGWTSEDKPMGPATYTIFKRAGDTDVGGLMQRPREDIPVHWTTYIATQDADATVARAKELGATILSEPMDVPKMGRFAIIQDPTGAVFGIWQSAS